MRIIVWAYVTVNNRNCKIRSANGSVSSFQVTGIWQMLQRINLVWSADSYPIHKGIGGTKVKKYNSSEERKKKFQDLTISSGKKHGTNTFCIQKVQKNRFYESPRNKISSLYSHIMTDTVNIQIYPINMRQDLHDFIP